MSKTVRRNAFEFDYQYEQEKRAQRKEQRQVRQLRQTKHSRFDFLNAE
jgi:hypothetical protein